MIKVEEYVKDLLKRKKITQKQLLDRMKELKLANEKTLCKQILNNALNLKMGYTWARRIEIALDLPEYSLIQMIGTPTEKEWKKIKEIKINV